MDGDGGHESTGGHEPTGGREPISGREPTGGHTNRPLDFYNTAFLVPAPPIETRVDTEGSRLHCAASKGPSIACFLLLPDTAKQIQVFSVITVNPRKWG